MLILVTDSVCQLLRLHQCHETSCTNQNSSLFRKMCVSSQCFLSICFTLHLLHEFLCYLKVFK